MKALSVRQPWASLIASGRKTIELRSWSPRYRGPVLVLACVGVWRGTDYPIGPRGVSLCVVDLLDVRAAVADDVDAACVALTEGGGRAWVLGNARAVEHVPVKGRLGLYDVSSDLLRSLSL